MTQPGSNQHPYNQEYFSSGPYAEVSYARYSQYWWSNRYYARLARRYGASRGRVLELGCGMGHLLAWLTGSFWVVGCDINTWALTQAKQNVPQGNFLVLSGDGWYAFPSASFDVVIAKHVVEHLPHPEQGIAEMSRVLRPGGLLILVTPNLSSPMRKKKKEHWIGYKDPTHISLKPPEEWLACLQAQGLHPRRVFSDGFWDAPYIPLIPTPLQKLFFGAPGGLQAIFGWSIIPLRMGESLIVLAEKA
ncbi:MAG TPA: methyltransferase domain-containing protein [Anaerolineales bacterium]|nr:methyltransferase domain-containing protein [Anaerolineales bacterium]